MRILYFLLLEKGRNKCKLNKDNRAAYLLLLQWLLWMALKVHVHVHLLWCYGISPAITCSTHFILDFAWSQVVKTFCIRPNSSYLQLKHIPVSVALSDWKNLYSSSPVDGRVFPHSITSRIKFLGTQRYTWLEGSTLRVKCLP